jgi:hypothetical protein
MIPTYLSAVSRRWIGGVFAWLFLLAIGHAAGAGQHYSGRVFYRGTKAVVPGVLVEVVEAEDDGKPTDEVLGSTRADAEGRFTVVMEKSTNGPVALVVSAVRESASSGGDRRSGGYKIKTKQIPLGFLSNPSATKPNTIFVERRRPGHGTENSNDD